MLSSSREILKINNLKVSYPSSTQWMLNGVSVTIEEGQQLALIGSSGSGKSTVAKALFQLLPQGSLCTGEIFVNGQNLIELDNLAMDQIRGKNIGLIFQDPMTRLNPLMTIGEHIIDTLKAHRKNEDYLFYKSKAAKLLDRVGIDCGRFYSYPHELSGGMRQRVAIALAIALDPLLVIADEPTTSLDVVLANQVMSELSNLCKEIGSALLLISHDLALASRWCSKVAILNEGKIVEDSFTKDFLSEPKSQMGKTLLDAAKKREESRAATLEQERVVLEVNNLRCWHPSGGWSWREQWIKSVEDISFCLCEAETLGVVGVSGCGKSTLCRALLGLETIRGGEVKLLGQNLLTMNKSRQRNAMKSIQMVFQDPCACLNPKMTAGEAIQDPLLIHNLMTVSQAREKVRDLLQQVGLTPVEKFQKRFPEELSGGQLQRVAIARALALEPKVLICDESVSMLDPQIQSEVLILLGSLQERFGLAILFITHDLSLATGFCKRVIVLNQGHIIEEGNGEELFKHPRSLLTQKLVESCPRLM